MLDKVNRQQFNTKSYTNKDYEQFKTDKVDPINDSEAESESGVKKRRKLKFANKKNKAQEDDKIKKFSLDEQRAKYIKPQNQQKQYIERFKQAQILAANQSNQLIVEKVDNEEFSEEHVSICSLKEDTDKQEPPNEKRDIILNEVIDIEKEPDLLKRRNTRRHNSN